MNQKPITEDVKKINKIQHKLLDMNPAQRSVQLDAISCLLEGSATTIDVKLPKEAQTTRGRPKGAVNKPKTTRREPSSFEHIEKKRKIEDKQTAKIKKQKLEEAKLAEKKEENPSYQKNRSKVKNN